MAANTPTLGKLIQIIQEVSMNHLMVKSFRFGPMWNMDNTLLELQTPYLWLEPMPSKMTAGNQSKKTGLQTFVLYCMDRISKDESNYNEILSDTKFILDTIITELDQHPLFVVLGLSFDQNSDILFEPVMEYTDTYSNGHSVEFTWKYPIRYTPCNVPISELSGYTYSLNNNVYQYSVTGIPGPTGPQGPIGPTGVQGVTGPQGINGTIGINGATGPQGFQGTSGINGATGSQGPTGPQGFQGIQGPVGIQGTTGPQGFQGVSGVQGITGPQGFQGTNGINGATGPQGFQGVQGATGSQGFQGTRGATGSQGFQGFQGETGSQGVQGATGPQGFQGTQGPSGSSNISELVGLVFDGGGGNISTSVVGYLRVPYGYSVSWWSVDCDQAGSIQFDIKNGVNSIIGTGNKPKTTSAQNGSASISGWSQSIISGSTILTVSIDSVTSINWCMMGLNVYRT